MKKYRIITKPGIWKYVVQKGWGPIWWNVKAYTALPDAEWYMDQRIKERDFKSEVIRSE